jgi:SNF2 family DNA or RNA helicase
MDTLKPNQIEVIDEAIRRDLRGGGLSLPLGFGKTRTSVCLGLKYDKGPILVVASKTLGVTWMNEIPKAFGPDFPFEYLHSDHVKNIDRWEPKRETKLVLTTPEVLAAAYRENNLEASFLKYNVPADFGPTILEYVPPKSHMIRQQRQGPGYIYSIDWGCLIIDEIQNCNNILREKCRAIACVTAHYRWGLSGTMFDEPRNERFLGYFTMLHIKGPRTLPDIETHMKETFKGFQQYIIHRTENKEFVKRPKYTEMIVSHDLSSKEVEIFEASKLVLKDLNHEVRKMKMAGNVDEVRRFSAYLLAMVTYVRQFLIAPIIPITSIYCDVADFTNRSELSTRVVNKFRELQLDSWLESEEALMSTRFTAIKEKTDSHPDERVIIFSCFRTTLTLLQHNLDAESERRGSERRTFTIDASMSIPKREAVVKAFEEYPNGIFLIPYAIGAEGLNLQCASVVMLMDLWWNSSKTQQAIGRVFRPGQVASEIFIYIFVSNTGMESDIIRKNIIKQEILKDLHVGSCAKKVPKMSIQQIITIIDSRYNKDLLTGSRK